MPAIEGTTQSALDTLQAKIDADPEIQAILKQNAAQITATHDKGGSARKFQHSIRDQIGAIAQRKGYMPTTDQVFINPNNGRLEGHGGWSGLNTTTKSLIIAAAAGAATLGTGAALGAFGGAAGGAAGGGGAAAAGSAAAPAAFSSGLGVTSGLGGLGMAGGAATAAGAGGTAATTAGGAGLLGTIRNSLSTPQGIGRGAELLGSVAGGIGKSQADERAAGVDYGILRDKLGLDAAGQNEDAIRNRADQNIRERQETRTDLNNAFQQSLQANLIKSWPTGGPQMPDRLTKYSLGPTGPTQGATNAASEIDRQMMVKILGGGGKGAPMPEFTPYQLQSPDKLPGASTSEKIMDLIGLSGNAANSFLNPPDSTANFQKWLAQFSGGGK